MPNTIKKILLIGVLSISATFGTQVSFGHDCFASSKADLVQEKQEKAKSETESTIEELFNDRKFDQLIQRLVALQSTDPDTAADYQRLLGRSYFETKKWQEAIDAYQKYLGSRTDLQRNSKDLTFKSDDTNADWKERITIARNDIGSSMLNLAFSKKNQNAAYSNQEYYKDLAALLEFHKQHADVRMNPEFVSDFENRWLVTTGALLFDLGQQVDLGSFRSRLENFHQNYPKHQNTSWIRFLTARVYQAGNDLLSADKIYQELAASDDAKSQVYFPSILHHYALESMALSLEESATAAKLKSEAALNSARLKAQTAITTAKDQLKKLRSQFPNYNPDVVTLDLANCLRIAKEPREALAEIQAVKTSLSNRLQGDALAQSYYYQKALLLHANLLEESDEILKAVDIYRQLQLALQKVEKPNNLQVQFANQSLIPVLNSHIRNQRWKELRQDSLAWKQKFGQFSPVNMVQDIEYQNALALSKLPKEGIVEPDSELVSISKNLNHSYRLQANWTLANMAFSEASNAKAVHYAQLSDQSGKKFNESYTKLKDLTETLLSFDFFKKDLTSEKLNQLQLVKTWHAESLLRLGDFANAKTEYEKLISDHPTSASLAVWKLGLAASILEPMPLRESVTPTIANQLKNELLSEASINQLKTDDEKALAYFYLGRSQWSGNTVDEAISPFDKSIGLKSDWPYGRLAMRFVLTANELKKDWNGFETAAKKFESISKGTEVQKFQIDQAIAKFNLNEFQNSLGILQKAETSLIALPDSVTKSQLLGDAVWWAANCYNQLKNVEKAKGLFAKFQTDFPNHSRIKEVPPAFLIASAAGNKDGMKETVERKTENLAAPALFATAQKSINEKKWPEAETTMQSIVDQFPNDPDLDRFLYHLAWVQFQQQKNKESRENFQKVLGLSDDDWKLQSRFFIASLDNLEKDYPNAEAGFLAVAGDAKQKELKEKASFNYAKVLQNQQKWASAAAAYEKLVADNPDSTWNLQALINASACYHYNKEPKKSSVTLKKVSTSSGEGSWDSIQPSQAIQIARHANQMELWDVAEAALNPHQLSAIPANLTSAFHFQKGMAKFGLEKWEEAQQDLTKVSAEPNSVGAQALFYLARSLENQSLTMQARDQYKKLVYGAYGENPPILIRRIKALSKYDVGRITLNLMNSETNTLLKEEYRKEAVRWFAKAVVQGDDLNIRSKAKDQMDRLKK